MKSIKIKRKLGERILNISEDLNIPRITVERVIRAYLDSLVDSAYDGETIVIDNIMSIKIVKNPNNGEVRLRGRVSPSLKNKLYVKVKDLEDFGELDDFMEDDFVEDTVE